MNVTRYRESTLAMRRLGWLGFWFFFGKGMLWLAGSWMLWQAAT